MFLYKRFIDDVLVGHHYSITVDEPAEVLDGFHADISVTFDAGDVGGKVAFLG